MSAGQQARLSLQLDGEDVRRLEVQAVVSEERRTLRLVGELDLAGRGAVEAAIARIAADGCTLVLDLRALTFMDATGVHVALGARRLCEARGCALRLMPGPAHVQRVFELAGMLDQLTVEPPGTARRWLSIEADGASSEP